jgi:NAD(P)H-quinone oxidoreductase subunit I
MTEEYELSSYDRHELNYDQVALGRLPNPASKDPLVHPVLGLGYLPKKLLTQSTESKTITNFDEK